ncbi:hypothetical protein [Streptomyces sp. NPDC055189]
MTIVLGSRRIDFSSAVRHLFSEGVSVQTPETTIVAVIAVIAAAFTVTACYALACSTTNKIAKVALDGSRSADRAQILNEVGAILRHLPALRWRRK